MGANSDTLGEISLLLTKSTTVDKTDQSFHNTVLHNNAEMARIYWKNQDHINQDHCTNMPDFVR